MRPNRDFGLITLARNPFAESDEYIAILVAGFHMMATAHALSMLGDPKNFQRHPVGGVISVNMNQQDNFATRFDKSSVEWDSEDGSNYTVESLRESLSELSKNGTPLARVDPAQFRECLEFLDQL
jgi:hypothetical protein